MNIKSELVTDIENQLKIIGKYGDINTDMLMPSHYIIDSRINYYLKNLVTNFIRGLEEIQYIINSDKYQYSNDFVKLQVENYIKFFSSINDFPNTKFCDILLKANKKLTKRQKEIFYYTYIEKFEAKDIEKILRIKHSTFTSHINKINLALNPEFNETYSIWALNDLLRDRPDGFSNEIIRLILFLPSKK